jgi:DNA-binding IclR family transcriptional regulator
LFAIDEILRLLKDGEWHTLEEIATKASLAQRSTHIITSFLAAHYFVEVKKEHRKLRLTPLTLEFVNDIQRIEREDINVFSSP